MQLLQGDDCRVTRLRIAALRVSPLALEEQLPLRMHQRSLALNIHYRAALKSFSRHPSANFRVKGHQLDPLDLSAGASSV